MPAIYMSQLSTAHPALMEGDRHQLDHHHQGHFQAFALPKDSPLLFPFMIGTGSTSDSSLSYGSPAADHHLMRQQQAILETQHMIGGSAAASVFATTPFPTVESIRDDMIEPSSYDPYDMGKLQVGRSVEAAVGGNWKLPSKMRITRKASADPGVGVAVKKPRRRAQAYEGISSQPNNLGVIRVCSDCNTTKTPLWRSGPCGPKSLCNACGIRQRKARRAMMVAAAVPAADNGVKVGTATPIDAMAVNPKVKKGKRADVDRRSLPFKKRCKVVQDHAAVEATADKTGVQQTTVAEVAYDACLSRNHHVDNIGLISWSRPSPPPAAASATGCSSFRSPSLPVQHDEITDAAMLLMTLSCGLVRS